MANVKIRQIYYDPKQKDHLDPACEHFFNDKANPSEFEFGVIKWFEEQGLLFDEGVEYTGFLSWKFHQKARITVERFLKFVNANPGYDVYLINPFPEQVVHQNNWHQAEIYHPGLICLTQRLFSLVGLDWNPLETPNFPEKLAYCNFWVGNRGFWDLYLKYGLSFYKAMQADLRLKDRFYLVAPGATSAGANYFTFFFERILTEILNHHPEIRVKSYHYSQSELENVFRPHFAKFLAELPQNEDISDLLKRSDWKVISQFRHTLTFRQFELEKFTYYSVIATVIDRLPALKAILQKPMAMRLKRKIKAYIDAKRLNSSAELGREE